MNKKAQTGTNNRIGLKWLNSLILAIAATLSFHYQPTIEAMERESISSEKTSSLTDELTEGQIETLLNQNTNALAEVLNLKTTTLSNSREQKFKQEAIKKQLNKAEGKLKLREGTTLDNLIIELIRHEKELNALLKKRSAEKLKPQILELQKSYQHLIRNIDSSLSSSERVYPYQESEEWRIYIEEHDQDPQLTKEQIEDRLNKHMLDLAEILNVSTTNSFTNGYYFREKKDIQKDITKELTKEQGKTYQTTGLSYDQLIAELIWHEKKLNALLQKRNAEELKQQISELQQSYQHMRRNLELALSRSEQV